MAVPTSTYSLSHAVSTFDPAFRQLGRSTTISTDSSIEDGKRYDYDILIYGATSFTGKLVVKYLLQHPQYKSSDFSFALGGRTKSKLDSLAEQVEAEGNTRPAVVCFPLSSSAGEGSEGEEIEEGVRKAVERCKVVVNLAGPFSTQNAEALIRCVSVLFVALCWGYQYELLRFLKGVDGMGGCDPAVRGVRWLILFLYRLFLCLFVLRISSYISRLGFNSVGVYRQCAQQGKHYVDLTVSQTPYPILLPFIPLRLLLPSRFLGEGGLVKGGEESGFRGCHRG
jgi:hypothetical protein